MDTRRVAKETGGEKATGDVFVEAMDGYLTQLERDKRELQSKIEDLRSSVRTIDTLIFKRKSELASKLSGEKINRKNSGRLIFETLILELITESKTGLRTSEIRGSIEKRNFNMNYNTLRSYVTSMRDKGLIQKSKTHSYKWIKS